MDRYDGRTADALGTADESHPAAAPSASHRARRRGGGRGRRAALLVTAAVVVAAGTWAGLARSRPPMFAPRLSGPDRLVTNEFAHWNPRTPGTRLSRDWDVTSGSLFVHRGVAWSGVPDAAVPDAGSSRGTGSSVFRMTTRRRDFDDVTVSLRLRNLGLTGTGRAAASEIDGVHVFLRWQSPEKLYVVSLNRRDGLMVVKKKLPGGDANGGTYVTLGQARYAVPYGRWQAFRVRIATSGGGLVTVTVARDGRQVLSATDDGSEGAAILAPGAVGLRGDNCDFEFTGFRVTRT
ncbi:hypothetical protein NE236_31805 [Actinoallomurus purpureus]|uniref:hypothetical protein n=1 Tax=Actinoallomurus purpureus TaxID=478114 RepID=UPI0020935EF1|nr:hypothetical protein [Actinoallomurus purpureus]MCO6009566.1 hypothetical protein [Actinoallomurus purpureus]